MKKILQKTGLAISTLATGTYAMAAAPDFSALTTSADLSGAGTAVLAVAGGVIVVLVAIKGFRLISKMF